MIGLAVLYVPGFVIIIPVGIGASLEFRTPDDGFFLPAPWL